MPDVTTRCVYSSCCAAVDPDLVHYHTAALIALNKLIATWEAAVANGDYAAVPHQLLPRHTVQSVAEFVATPLYKAYAGHFIAYDQPDDYELIPLICAKTTFLEQLFGCIAVQLDDGTYMDGYSWVKHVGYGDGMVENCTNTWGGRLDQMAGQTEVSHAAAAAAAARLLLLGCYC
uniref:Uncharacterized protein n=1 Tax=Tetradesmus obliquus TaxID=3088 RepID=A0A383VVU3_TETOB